MNRSKFLIAELLSSVSLSGENTQPVSNSGNRLTKAERLRSVKDKYDKLLKKAKTDDHFTKLIQERDSVLAKIRKQGR